MRIKSGKGSISIFVLIALLFYIGFLMLLYAGNLNKMQTISERAEAIKAIYSKNFNNIDDVYNRRLSRNDNMQPVINWPSQIITNVTDIRDSYEEFGATGGRVEYVVSNNKFSSIKEVVNNTIEKGSYGTITVTATAYGNNGLITKDEKNIEIIRGMKVTNEAELKTAFATTGDLYVYIDKDIECTETISTDNINHKLDLNNHSITNNITNYLKNEYVSLITIGENSKLTIMDKSKEQKGYININLIEEAISDGKDRENSIFVLRNNGILTIESGRIFANISQKMLHKNDGTNVQNHCSAIDNYGTVNLNGGIIETNVEVRACTYLVVKIATANGRGIVNAGTVNLNSGNIIVKTDASMLKAKGTSIWGKTYAYSYGIVNVNGEVNRSENVTFELVATAHKESTYAHDSEQAEITQTAKTSDASKVNK